jgi:hypothetical protein
VTAVWIAPAGVVAVGAAAVALRGVTVATEVRALARSVAQTRAIGDELRRLVAERDSLAASLEKLTRR